MKLFIIGNGFDKGHGLNTGYWDFRAYLENLYPDFLCAFEQHYDIYPRINDEAKKNLLWNQLESNLANIDEEVMIEDALSIDMGLESGDVGIEDTLYEYFSEEYKYIELLAKYLKQWVRTIRIRDTSPKTNHINKLDDSLYITFNYTSVLETVYGISDGKITHIHGSLRQNNVDPVLGHGNKERIEKIEQKLNDAENVFNEKEVSICRVVKDYYTSTFKNVERYMASLMRLTEKNILEIIMIGHSVAGVDIPYFRYIDSFTKGEAQWTVYYYSAEEKQRIFNALIDCGVEKQRLHMKQANEFYNL